VAPVSREWTRIGRSLSADIRFDDATVSRRHALVVNQADGVRVLDDRSLNGVYVNGERVDWSPLADGDEIAIGRHTIHYFDSATVGSGASAPAARRRVTLAKVSAFHGRDDRGPVPQGRDGQDDYGADPRRRAPARRALRPHHRPRPAGQPVGLLRRARGRLADRRRRALGRRQASEAVHDGIIPATPILAEVERSMSGKMGRELVLRKALKGPRQSYDVILIDCPPALGLLTVNGLVAADWALVSPRRSTSPSRASRARSTSSSRPRSTTTPTSSSSAC
jgi:predicted component of type VI protein secretion system